MPSKLKFRPQVKKPDLTVDQILAWADLYKMHHGKWPMRTSGHVGLTGNTWSGLDACLKGGCRGLNPGSSLAKVLLEFRGRRHNLLLPKLTTKLILKWADAFHKRTGDWPGQDSGPITDADETWSAVDCALFEGLRGLPGGSSLAQLLAAERGARNHLDLPTITLETILIWADAHKARTGDWPHQSSGPIVDAPGETWSNVGTCLLQGLRGWPRGSSIARLLSEHRGARNQYELPRLTEQMVLAWADAYHARTGKWPNANSGKVPETQHESWSVIDTALYAGTRGFPGKDSLTRLLARHRGIRNPTDLPPLTEEKIKELMREFHKRTGTWPTQLSGEIPGANGDTWRGIDKALTRGRRGLPGGSSLAKLKAKMR